MTNLVDHFMSTIICLKKTLADKDAEITHQRQDIENLRALLHKTETAAMKNVGRLEDLVAQQDQKLKDLGKALQEANQNTLKAVWGKCYDLMDFQSKQRTHYDPGDSYIPSLECGEIMEILESLGLKKDPPKDEPELVICPNVGKKDACSNCYHIKPHIHSASCDLETNWNNGRYNCVKCIPYKKEEPTVPEIQSIEIHHAHSVQIEACHDRLDKHDTDIGALTLRLDNLEDEVKRCLKEPKYTITLKENP